MENIEILLSKLNEIMLIHNTKVTSLKNDQYQGLFTHHEFTKRIESINKETVNRLFDNTIINTSGGSKIPNGEYCFYEKFIKFKEDDDESDVFRRIEKVIIPLCAYCKGHEYCRRYEKSLEAHLSKYEKPDNSYVLKCKECLSEKSPAHPGK